MSEVVPGGRVRRGVSNVLVIGSGAAGLRVRELGVSISLVERRNPGGCGVSDAKRRNSERGIDGD
jgi:succinate dehydrogenase/fumarate reductase flavoprotein subunit